MNAEARTPGRGRLLAAIALLIIWATGYTWGTWRYFTSVAPGGNDFLHLYVAFGAYLWHGINPYSSQATDLVNQYINGRPARPGKDEGEAGARLYAGR